MAIVSLANAKQFPCAREATLLDAARLQGLVLEHSCRTGRCGVCKTKVISGTTQAIKSEESLSADEQAAGYILTCARTALDDVSLAIEDLAKLATIKTQTLPCRIDNLQHLSSDVIKVMLRLPPNNNFAFVSGQYIDVIAKNGIRRSYSIANAQVSSTQIELHIRQVPSGEMSAYWFGEAKLNDLLRFEGPHGTFYLRDKPQKNIIFLATGTGIAPVKSMLEDLQASDVNLQEKSIVIYWGGRIPSDIYWQPEFNNLAVRFVPVLSRANNEWIGRRGHVQDALIADGIDLTDSVVYACGSNDMIHSAQTLLCEIGLSSNNFYSDAFVSSK